MNYTMLPLIFNSSQTWEEKRSAAPVATASIRQNFTLEYSEARQSRQEFNSSQPVEEQTIEDETSVE